MVRSLRACAGKCKASVLAVASQPRAGFCVIMAAMAQRHAATPGAPALTTPCTLQALEAWVQQVQVLASGGAEGGADPIQITTTATKITAT